MYYGKFVRQVGYLPERYNILPSLHCSDPLPPPAKDDNTLTVLLSIHF